MATRVVKTAGQVAFEDLQALFRQPTPWCESTAQDKWEAFAAKHNIQPITEEVADKPTDGELLVKAFDTKYDGGNDAVAAEFLRLRAERDGEQQWPVVTAKMWGHSHGVYVRTRGNADDCYQAAADRLNAELARQAGK